MGKQEADYPMSTTTYRVIKPLIAVMIGIAITMGNVGIARAQVTAKTDGSSLLSNERWRENSYGLSLLPPLDSRLLEMTADDAVLRIAGRAGGGTYTFKVFIKKRREVGDARFERESMDTKTSNRREVVVVNTPKIDPQTPLTLDQITQMAMKQIADAQPTAILLAQKTLNLRVGQESQDPKSVPARVLYFKLSDKKRGPWVLGQAFMQITPMAITMVEMDVDETQYAAASPIFEAMVSSIDLEDPKAIEARRAAWVAQGDAWRKTLSTQKLHGVLKPEQWLRIVQGDRDVGYMRLIQRTDNEMDHPGIRVDVQTRLEIADQAIDSLANFFLSDNGDHEVWSIRTTVRPLRPPAATAKNADVSETTWGETGVRDKDKITVTRSGPTGNETFNWDMPKGYISQVEMHLFDATAPQDKPRTEMGFFAYSPSIGRLAYRTERIILDNAGGMQIHTRTSPEQPEQVSYFSAGGVLIKRVMPSGQTILPTTKRELMARWSLK